MFILKLIIILIPISLLLSIFIAFINHICYGYNRIKLIQDIFILLWLLISLLILVVIGIKLCINLQ
jgi:hypothetical protein